MPMNWQLFTRSRYSRRSSRLTKPTPPIRAFGRACADSTSRLRPPVRRPEVATERYDRGLTDFLNVLDAARQQFTLEQQRAEVARLAGDSFVELHKALGGGWPPNEVIPSIRRPDPAVVAAVKRLAQDPPHARPPPPPGLMP